MRKLDDKIIFVTDANIWGTNNNSQEDASYFVDIYKDYDPLLESLINGFKDIQISNKFYTDKWGTFLSGYSAIKASDGIFDGLIGMDISVETIKKLLKDLIMKLVLFFFCYFNYFFYFFIYFR